MKYLYCEKCHDLVLEKDTKSTREIFGSIIKTDRIIHYYTKMANAYGSGPFARQRVGYCPTYHPVFCGEVREPTSMEYFILYICNTKRNKAL